jgi:hypothetical protein
VAGGRQLGRLATVGAELLDALTRPNPSAAITPAQPATAPAPPATAGELVRATYARDAVGEPKCSTSSPGCAESPSGCALSAASSAAQSTSAGGSPAAADRGRHFAMNWLCGYADEWDETPTDT